MKKIALNTLGVIVVEAALFFCSWAATGAPMNPITALILAWVAIGMSAMVAEDCSNARIKTTTIGYLMYLANGEGKRDIWYSLKQRLCDRYGINDGYDVQCLPGKKCYSCDGTGIFVRYHSFGSSTKERCYRCTEGWYKTPSFVLLQRIKVGDHVFHKPVGRQSKLCFPDIPISVKIEGYIEHSKKKYGWLAFSILYIIFDRKKYISYVKGFGIGWRCSWWLPQNYLYNFMHIRRHGWDAAPFTKLRMKVKHLKRTFRNSTRLDDLPF